MHFRLQQQIGEHTEQSLAHLRRNAVGRIFRNDLECLSVGLQSLFHITTIVEIQGVAHEQRGFLRRIFQSAFQQRDIPLNLIAAGLDFLGISVVIQSRFSKARFHLPILRPHLGGGENLFVNDAHKMQARRVTHKAGNVMPRIGHGLVAAIGARLEMYASNAAAHEVGRGHILSEPIQTFGSEHLVRIQHQHPITSSMLEREIAGGGEIIAPIEMMYFGTVGLGDLHRAIGGAGVHHHNLMRHAIEGGQTLIEELLLVFHDHADAQTGLLGEFWKSRPILGGSGEVGFLLQRLPSLLGYLPLRGEFDEPFETGQGLLFIFGIQGDLR